MAISTSPYQQNDYQAANTFRPYELPVNDIIKSISAQNAFWDAGAAKVKQVYENALGLKLSLEPNKQLRDSFMKESEKKLAKLSTMNLADASVQRQGFGIFKPLMQDEGVVYDDAMTRHFEKVRMDALSYRNKDNGEGYHDNNLKYAMDGYEEFVNSKDRMAGKQFYQKRKEYTPYYDPTQEISTILKNCGKDSTETERPFYNNGQMSGYSNVQKSEGMSAKKVNGCLSGMLSDKARRQIEIDGYVTYKNNPQALAEKYTRFASHSLNYIQKEFDTEVVGKLAGLEAKLKKGQKLNDTEKAEYETYKALGESYDNQISNYKQQLQAIADGDYSFINKNMERFAGAIHMNDIVGAWAEGASYQKVSNRMIADPVQLTHIKYNQQLSLQNDSQNFEREENEKQRLHDMNKLMLQQSMKGTGGKLKKDKNGNWVIDTDHLEGYYGKELGEADIKEYGQKQFDNEFQKITRDIADYNLNLVSQLKDLAGNTEITLPNGTKVKVADYIQKHGVNDVLDLSKDGFLTRYLKSGGAHPSIKNMIATKQELENKQRLYKRKQDQIENQLRQDNPELFDRGHLKKFKPIQLEDGTVITPDMIQDALEGKSSIITYVPGTTGGAVQGSGLTMGTSSSGSSSGQFFVNGKPIETTYGKKGNVLHRLYQDISVEVGEKRNKINSKRNALYKETNFELKGFKQIMTPDEDVENLLNRGLTKEQRKDKNLVPIAFNGTGEVIVQVNGMNEKEAIVHIQKLGVGAGTPQHIGGNKFIIKTENLYKVPGTLSEADQTLVKLIGGQINQRKLQSPKTPVGGVVDNITQSFLGKNGLVNFDIVIKKGAGGVPNYYIWRLDEKGQKKDMVNVSGPIMDPNIVVETLRTQQQFH